MKSLKWLIGILMLLFVFSLAQAQEYQKTLSIKGEVFQDHYIGFGSVASASQPQYTVKVVIKNNQQKDISFDEIEVAFSPKQGTPLRMRTYRYDEKMSKALEGHRKDENEERLSKTLDAYKKQKKLFYLQPGKSEEYEYSTNGYTYSLLSDAGDEPLMFAIVFVRQGKVVAGPYRAFLLPLKDLPALQPGGKGKVLKFFAL